MSVPAQAIARQMLLENADVAAIVGTRVLCTTAAQGLLLPYIVCQRVSAQHEHHMGGSSGLVLPVVQVDAFGDDYDETEDLGTAIREAMDGYRGAVTVGGVATIIKLCFLANDNSQLDQLEPASETGVYRVSYDFNMGFAESVPAL